MAKTLPFAHKSQLLQGILNSLNNPGGCDSNEIDVSEENVTLSELANVNSSDRDNEALLILANQHYLSTRASIHNNAQQQESTEGATVKAKGSKVTQQAQTNSANANEEESIEIFSSDSSTDIDWSDDDKDDTRNNMAWPKKPTTSKTPTPTPKKKKAPAAPKKKKGRAKVARKAKRKLPKKEWPWQPMAEMPTATQPSPEGDKTSPSVDTVPRTMSMH
jgi:hypothetical protein